VARSYNPKVNGHVTYFTAAGKPQPAIITAVASATVVSIRVGHSGATAASINRAPIDYNAAGVVNTWRP